MTESLPEIRNGRLPMGPGRAGQCHRGVDWKTTRLIQALVLGIDAEIEDDVCGLTLAGKPLPLKEAARAVGMSVKRVRALQLDPAFQQAFKTATEAYRATLEPGNLAMALEIRTDNILLLDKNEKAPERDAQRGFPNKYLHPHDSTKVLTVRLPAGVFHRKLLILRRVLCAPYYLYERLSRINFRPARPSLAGGLVMSANSGPEV